MIKNLCKTLIKNSNFPNSKTPIRLLSNFSTKSPSDEQQLHPQSQIGQPNETEERKIETLVAKPSQIPYQSKVANWVNLIGTIKSPIEFLTCANGKSWAATLISQEQYSPNLPIFWTPVIFQGDLAYTAMMHLKVDDMVYVGGPLSPEHLPIDLTKNQANLQVLVRDLHFVRGYRGKKNRFFKYSGNAKGNNH